MSNPLDELKVANNAYHVAANEIMEANAEVFGVPVEEMMEAKAKFGYYHDNIFSLMHSAQNLLEEFFSEE